MSNQVKHTAEPWALFRDGQSVGAADGTGVCEVWPRNEEGFPNTEGTANARRIVACVNACRGLSTIELEEFGLVGAVGTELIELEKQRDQLLAALEVASGKMKAAHNSMFEQCLSNPVFNAWGKEINVAAINDLQLESSHIDAAIAAAKGGAA